MILQQYTLDNPRVPYDVQLDIPIFAFQGGTTEHVAALAAKAVRKITAPVVHKLMKASDHMEDYEVLTYPALVEFHRAKCGASFFITAIDAKQPEWAIGLISTQELGAVVCKFHLAEIGQFLSDPDDPLDRRDLERRGIPLAEHWLKECDRRYERHSHAQRIHMAEAQAKVDYMPRGYKPNIVPMA